MLYQQGDVLIETVKSIPSNVKKAKKVNGKYVLAEGEATGHAHVVADKGVTLYGEFGNMFLSAKKQFTVTHEEHKAIKVPTGDYKIRQVREYDHFEEEAKVVKD